jgi:hypothetical protein
MPVEMQSIDEKLSTVEALRGIIDIIPHPVFVKDDETRFAVVIDGGRRFGQGYYFGRALPAPEVPAMIDELNGPARARRA